MKKLEILMVLIAIGGVALFQVGNVCTAEDVLKDMTIQVPSHEYREVCAIGDLYVHIEDITRYNSHGVVIHEGVIHKYKISVHSWGSDEDQYMPIDLLILDRMAYRKFQKGENFGYWGQMGMINGTYYFNYSGRYSNPPCHVILQNRSEQPLHVHIGVVPVE